VAELVVLLAFLALTTAVVRGSFPHRAYRRAAPGALAAFATGLVATSALVSLSLGHR
jgi:hypothetical protein